ncbi:unnamed protein product [Fusarium equiseti]|uniref:Rhodopsin domain-containing protein n=1 Tax=Fusarium equiseti TaxID=61235 RepID=A0A8J2IMM7_FUSEQ|nr:unnamed protein product [Fusarium equiseti]
MAIETRAAEIAGTAYAFLILSTIATCLRVYCRGFVIKAFAMDDWFAVIAQFMFIVYGSYCITGVHYGTGLHVKDMKPGHVTKAMQMWWTCEPTYVLANMALKASIAIFLLRICVTRTHRMIIYIATGVTELYSLFFFLLFILQCRPTSLFWLRVTENPPAGSCLDATIVANVFYGYSAISCASDWTYSILPMFLVWKLQMSKRTKISVVAILAAGAIASSATIIRFPYLYSLTDIDDFLYSTSDVAIWSSVETGLGITASAVATLRPLLRNFLGQGSSAEGAGNSARPWQRTGGSNHPTGGYLRSTGPNGEEAFDLHDTSNKRIGVTTIIDHGDDAKGSDSGFKRSSRSDESDSVAELRDWNTSDSDLAGTADKNGQPRPEKGWNVLVKKTVTQTRGSDMA